MRGGESFGRSRLCIPFTLQKLANIILQNGEITDPPAAESASSTRYAQSIQRPISPAFDVPEDALFCKTCLKNQHFFSETLASYFPSPDAPDYADYEKGYPSYRKDLEERYPQVCPQCEPRVRERIRATGYAAKTDHLRRMMDRTRGSDIPYGVSRWQRLFVFLGGILWSLSIAGQLVWDGFNLVPDPGAGELTDEDMSLSTSRCLRGIIQGTPPFPTCSGLADSLAGMALALGAVSFWWNPRLQEKLTRIGGRITGKAEFYKLQAILLAARTLAFWFISNDESNPLMTKGLHGSMLFFVILVSLDFGHFAERILT